MIEITGLGNCEIIAQDEFSITVVVEGTNQPVYLDREDYPELSAECKYQKQVTDMVKDVALNIDKDEYVYINVYDAFDARQVSPVERRTKLEDYLITFEALNGHAFVDDLNVDGTCTLVSKQTRYTTYNFAAIVAGIEEYYRHVG